MFEGLMKRLVPIALLTALIIVSAVGCGAGKGSQSKTVGDGKHPVVQIEMADGGKMVFELYPEYSPKTVDNFIQLAKNGFYNGLTFHRIVKDFMVQGGDPEGTGAGGSTKTIPGEFADNGFTQNTLKHTRGVISMARSKDPNSAGSQFFIMDAANSYLDGKYAAFGKLIEGDDVLTRIADTPVSVNPSTEEVSLPNKVVKMKTVTVLTK